MRSCPIQCNGNASGCNRHRNLKLSLQSRLSCTRAVMRGQQLLLDIVFDFDHSDPKSPSNLSFPTALQLCPDGVARHTSNANYQLLRGGNFSKGRNNKTIYKTRPSKDANLHWDSTFFFKIETIGRDQPDPIIVFEVVLYNAGKKRERYGGITLVYDGSTAQHDRDGNSEASEGDSYLESHAHIAPWLNQYGRKKGDNVDTSSHRMWDLKAQPLERWFKLMSHHGYPNRQQHAETSHGDVTGEILLRVIATETKEDSELVDKILCERIQVLYERFSRTSQEEVITKRREESEGRQLQMPHRFERYNDSPRIVNLTSSFDISEPASADQDDVSTTAAAGRHELLQLQHVSSQLPGYDSYLVGSNTQFEVSSVEDSSVHVRSRKTSVSSRSSSVEGYEQTSIAPSPSVTLQHSPTIGTPTNPSPRPRRSSKSSGNKKQAAPSLQDLNGRFQHIVELIGGFTEMSTFDEKYQTNLEMINLAQDFVHNAKTYGKIIISERYLDEEQKTVKPVKFGGLAGGQKYVVNNILFKFAVDEKNGIFGGDDAQAAKDQVAGHDLKGLISVYNCNISGLSLPMMVLIDYKGFRLVAMTILPIHKRSIVYGSSNACATVHYPTDSSLIHKIKSLGDHLNLAPHQVRNTSPEHIFYTPVDLEVHVGSDGRFYMIDFSRMFPPETPRVESKMGHMFRLLRPEFVKNYPIPLCSDAHSRIIDGTPHRDDLNRQIIRATDHLYETVIPAFASEFVEIVSDWRTRGDILGNYDKVIWHIHKAGINARHIGRIHGGLLTLTSHNIKMMGRPDFYTCYDDANLCASYVESQWYQDSLSDCVALCRVEMICRTMKSMLRAQLRDKMKELRVALEHPYQTLVINFLSNSFAKTTVSELFWREHLIPAVSHKFGINLTQDNDASGVPQKFTETETLLGFSKGTTEVIRPKTFLLKRLLKMMGIKIKPHALSNFESRLQRTHVPIFEGAEIKSLGAKVKHMSIINHARGYVNKLNNPRNVEDKTYYLEKSLRCFDKALRTNPNNKYILRNYAQVMIRNASLRIRMSQNYVDKKAEKSNEKLTWSMFNTLCGEADRYFRYAVQSDPSDWFTLIQYATFLVSMEQRKKATEIYLRTLESRPDYVHVLQELRELLVGRTQTQEVSFVLLITLYKKDILLSNT
ncbi:hypothetical protein PROFUN_09321 [Planoprotostelium fungivorum]|uniref:Clu domain-containing protein n=1 Tax=Planoprotostelium fungivorum TaxID=1890364 RepID=A0A2P6NHA8_9EUKA|nr:hypothetical protein PROFUN_09321 [Planoprotostelium fungivorum]